MENKGFVTVFVTCMVIALWGLVTCALRVVLRGSTEARTAIATRASLSDVKATYNSYIFEHYHILLFDKNCGGRGEGYLEESIQNRLGENLGENAQVEEVAIAGFDMIYDQDCQNLKEQISAYAPYGLMEYGIDEILAKTDGEDGSLYANATDETTSPDMDDSASPDMDDSASPDMDDSASLDKDDSTGGEQVQGSKNSGDEDDGSVGLSVDDPRDYTESMSDVGLMQIVIPDGMQVSSQRVDMSGFPSKLLHTLSVFHMEFNQSFDDYGDLKKDLKVRASWLDALIQGGELPIYARNVFNSALTTVNENTVFQMELEYLIHGGDSDAENLKAVIKQIMAVRLPLNYAYLLSDSAKMTEIRGIAIPLSVLTLIPEPILKYLLAGCWAYVESVVDVRSLLAGKKIAFKKDATTWQTSITALEDCETLYATEDENGLSYEDYLTILLVFQSDVLPYRMLDLMQVNVQQEQKDFSMLNAAVGLRVDFSVLYGEKRYQMTQYDCY